MTLQDIGSERAVLAGIYQYGNDALIDVADLISSDTFTIESNQILFSCLEQALKDNKSIDLTAVITTAERMGLSERIIKDKTDVGYIRSLLNFPIKLENVRGYAKRLAKLEFARMAQAKHKEAHDELGRLKGSESIDEILAISENAIFDLIQDINKGKEDSPQLIADDSDELLQHLIDNPSDMAGLPTPWPCYNGVIGGGLRNGGVNLIAARPGVGKSNLGKELALHFANILNMPVIILDTEMQKNDFLFRSLASMSNIPTEDIETGQFGQDEETKQKVLDTNQQLKQLKIHYKNIAGKAFEEVLSIIRRWVVKDVGYDENGNTNDCLVIYDYFKLMTPDSLENMQEYQAMGFQISRLSDFCKEYNFPCMAFVQVNRDGIRRETSDIISQSDRLLWLCHSAAVFKPKLAEERLDGDNSNRKLIILKSRFGPGMPDTDNYINMIFEGEIAKITERGFQEDMNRILQIEDEGFENDVRPGINFDGDTESDNGDTQ